MNFCHSKSRSTTHRKTVTIFNSTIAKSNYGNIISRTHFQQDLLPFMYTKHVVAVPLFTAMCYSYVSPWKRTVTTNAFTESDMDDCSWRRWQWADVEWILRRLASCPKFQSAFWRILLCIFPLLQLFRILFVDHLYECTMAIAACTFLCPTRKGSQILAILPWYTTIVIVFVRTIQTWPVVPVARW